MANQAYREHLPRAGDARLGKGVTGDWGSVKREGCRGDHRPQQRERAARTMWHRMVGIRPRNNDPSTTCWTGAEEGNGVMRW